MFTGYCAIYYIYMYYYAVVFFYSKVFDTVNHELLIDLLQSLGIDPQDVKPHADLYWNQQVAVIDNGEIVNEHQIEGSSGMRGFTTSFFLYIEMIVRSIDNMCSIKMGDTVNSFAYDTVIFAKSERQL